MKTNNKPNNTTMKKQFILLFLLAASMICYCQEKTENVIVTTGSTLIWEGGSLDWIIGENMLDHTVSNGNQTYGAYSAGPEEPEFLVYPTVTRGPVTLAARDELPEDLYVALYDVTNKLLDRKAWVQNPMTVDLSDFNHGIYMIHIVKEDQSSGAVFRIVRE